MKLFRFFPRGLWQTGLRYLSKNRWFSFFMVVGIAIGVAVVVAIDIANANAIRSFELSKQAVFGKATHQIQGGPEGLDESVYVQLRLLGLADKAAPVIEEFVTSPELGEVPYRLMGIDVFADFDFRSYFGSEHEIAAGQLVDFLTVPGAVLVSAGTASRFGIDIGSRLEIDIAGRKTSAYVAGLIEPVDSLSNTTLEGVILTDLATAQEMTGKIGKMDWIDLIIPESSNSSLDQIQSMLPEGVQISEAGSRSSAIDEMTSAFRTNLTALSLLALLVGIFLIYNTITYSVVRRRALFGLLRCLGVARSEIVALVVAEAFIVGILGSIVGLLLGILLSRQTVAMVSQTVNDLYFTTTVRPVVFNLGSLVKGSILGVTATIFAAFFPALEASLVPPRIAMARSGLERKTKGILGWITLTGIGLILIGVMVLLIPSQNIYLGFGGTVLVVLGLALESALALVISMRLLQPLLGRMVGFLGKMAPASLINNLSRTSVASAALMVAVAVAIGMNLMINSFRSTVTAWLEQTLMGDIYVSAPGFVSTNSTETIQPKIINELQAWPQIERLDTLRTVNVESGQGTVILNATENPDFGYERQYKSRSVPVSELWETLNEGGILVSEALVYRFGLEIPGAELTLLTNQGWEIFPIVGVIYEYTSSQGSIWMAMDVYRANWQDDGITALALRLNENVNIDLVSRQIQDEFVGIQQLIVRPNRVLRAEVLDIFDRTFAITNAMRVMATLVAFIGVLTTAMLLQLEKRREMGILRALGMTTRQLWGLVMIESGLIGLVAGFLALPTGSILARILVDVINRRSFGWTIQLQVPASALLQGLFIALVASILAGIYPAQRLNQMVAAEAIRYE